MLNEFEKIQIKKFLNHLEEKDHQPVLNLKQKDALGVFISDLEKNTKSDNIQPEVVREVVREVIPEDQIESIIKRVTTELQVKNGTDGKDGKNGSDGKDAPTKEELILSLKQDIDFITNLKTNIPLFAGGGGYGEKDILRLIEQEKLPLNPKYFGPDEDGNWRLNAVGDVLYQEYKVNGVWIPQCECKATELYDCLILTEDEIPIITEDGNFLVQEQC